MLLCQPEKATPCPDLMVSLCIKSFPQQQQTWAVNSSRSRVDSQILLKVSTAWLKAVVSDSSSRNMTPVVSCYHGRLQCYHREPIRPWTPSA